MPDDPSAPLPTPTNYQRTTGGTHLRWQPPTPEHLQEMLPAYEVVSILGQGGMGAVYKGRQKSLDRVVAIKILPPEAAEDDMQFAERFKNEARTMAKMNHPAIVHVYDFGETTEGQLYIVMEFIDGTDVAKMIQSQGKLPEDYALSITAHVCDALGYAHTQGVVHRDIKPANVLINQQGQVKVADFGLAKATDPSQMGLTKTNMAMGTPDFVSPEALMPGVPLDGRADLYAVGVMLYNMLTGTIPRGAFRMPSATLQTDARFDKIILKSMEMDRENRYQTALDLRRDLDVILTTPAAKSGGQTLPAQQAAPPQKPMGKSPSAPQRKEGSAGTPARSVPAADKNGRTHQAADKRAESARQAEPIRAPVQTPKKSNAVMIYGIAAAVVVIGGGAFLLSGGKKPAAAGRAAGPPAAAAPPETALAGASALPKPATPPPPKPASAPAAVASVNEKWVDGLAQFWSNEAKSKKGFARESSGGTRLGPTPSILNPIMSSEPVFRDQAARIRWRSVDPKSEIRLVLRDMAESGKRASYAAVLKPSNAGTWELSFQGPHGIIGNRAVALPSSFDPAAAHVMEFRAIGERLTALVDGKEMKWSPDRQLTAGHPGVDGVNVVIESFEYANLDPAGSAPALAAAKPEPILTFGGHRYQLVQEMLDWNQAKAKAEAMGGHLAVVTSKEENEWIQKNITMPKSEDGHIRLGALRSGPKGSAWTWFTGEPVDLALWGGKGPDGSGDSLTFDSRTKNWDDVYASNGRAFLVEWDDDGTAKPASAIAAAAPLAKPVDLLALVDVKRDTVKGTWTFTGGSVISKGAGETHLLEFRQTLPPEYDFEIEFTPDGGKSGLNQVLPVPGGNVFWIMDAGSGEMRDFYFGPCLDGKRVNDRSEVKVSRAQLKPGQRYRSLVEVRKNSLRALIDGEEVLQWQGDLTRFTGDSVWTVREPKFLGVGAYKREITFHKAEQRPPGVSPSPAATTVASAPSSAASAPSTSAGSTDSSDRGAATPSVPNGRDLLAGVDGQRDSLYKPWRLEGGVLKSPLDAGSQETIMLTSTGIPANYDLRYRITRERSGNSIRFLFVQGSGGGYVNVDGTDTREMAFFGFANMPRPKVASGGGKWIPPGRAHDVVIQVREGSIACLIDGEEILRAEGITSAKGQEDSAFNPSASQKPLAIGLSHSGGPLIVHEARLVPFDTPMALARLSSNPSQSPARAGTAIPAELTALDEQFLKLKAERVTAPFEAEVAKLNTGYVGGIDRAIAEEKKAGRLDGIIALESEKKLIETKQPMPETDDAALLPALKNLRGIYRGAFAKLMTTRDANLKALTEPLDKRLAQMETDFIKADRVADAKTVRAYRDALAKSPHDDSATAPQPPPVASPVEIKGSSWRAAATWCLQAKGIVWGNGFGPTFKVDDLPPGRFEINRLHFPP